MSEMVYEGSSSRRLDGAVSLFYEGEEHSMVDNLHDIINAQNERIAALEEALGRIMKSKGWIE